MGAEPGDPHLLHRHRPPLPLGQHQRPRPPQARVGASGVRARPAGRAPHPSRTRAHPACLRLARARHPGDERLGLRQLSATAPHRRAPGDRVAGRLRPRRRRRDHQHRRLLGRFRQRPHRRHGELLQQADQLRRRRHLEDHLRPAQGWPRPSPRAGRPHRQRSDPAARRAQPHRGASNLRSGHGREHHDDPRAAGHRPALPARGAVHPDRLAAAAPPGHRARTRRQSPGAGALPSGGGQLRGRRHHGRCHLLRHVRHRQAHALHRHRHERRDGPRQQGLAPVMRLFGRACVRGRRREARHARQRGRHRRHLHRRQAGALIPHDRRRPGRRHLRQRPHRPARRALLHRAARQVRAP